MKNKMKRLLTLMLVLLLTLSAYAQKESFSHTLKLGIGSPILDNGLGLNVGLNSARTLSPHFSIEGQISYIHTRINASFLSGRLGRGNAVNLLAGGRLYLIPEDRKTRFYLNLLVGGNYEQEKLDGLEERAGWAFGFSVGAYVVRSKFVLGLSFDTPAHLLLKVGYSF